jgi:replicative DNA helicase
MGRLRTGIPDLDLILGGGLEPGSLVILAGAPGTGTSLRAWFSHRRRSADRHRYRLRRQRCPVGCPLHDAEVLMHRRQRPIVMMARRASATR